MLVEGHRCNLLALILSASSLSTAGQKLSAITSQSSTTHWLCLVVIFAQRSVPRNQVSSLLSSWTLVENAYCGDVQAGGRNLALGYIVIMVDQQPHKRHPLGNFCALEH